MPGDADDITDTSVTTTADGVYRFANLPSRNFRAMFTPPVGHVLTTRGQDGNPALASDPDPATGQTGTIVLGVGASNTATDAGMFRQADLQVAKTNGVTAVVPGLAVTYTFTATNAGPSTSPGRSSPTPSRRH